MVHAFPINPVLQSMTYQNGELTIVFIKGKDRPLEKRQYGPVPVDIAYGWLYKKTAKECLSYYAKNIRKKFTLLKII
jgi:hypothetical protein